MHAKCVRAVPQWCCPVSFSPKSIRHHSNEQGKICEAKRRHYSRPCSPTMTERRHLLSTSVQPSSMRVNDPGENRAGVASSLCRHATRVAHFPERWHCTTATSPSGTLTSSCCWVRLLFTRHATDRSCSMRLGFVASHSVPCPCFDNPRDFFADGGTTNGSRRYGSGAPFVKSDYPLF